jgi:hypothetical protein
MWSRPSSGVPFPNPFPHLGDGPACTARYTVKLALTIAALDPHDFAVDLRARQARSAIALDVRHGAISANAITTCGPHNVPAGPVETMAP